MTISDDKPKEYGIFNEEEFIWQWVRPPQPKHYSFLCFPYPLPNKTAYHSYLSPVMTLQEFASCKFHQQKIKEIIMTAVTPNMNKTDGSDKSTQIQAKIKSAWNKLNDEDIKLYTSNRAQFLAKLKEKQNVSREEAEKKLQEFEKSCGSACGSEKVA